MSSLRQQRGLALVIVLSVLVLLSVMATSHVKNVRTESVLIAQEVDAASARALTQAATELAIMGLLARRGESPWPLDGTVVPLTLDGKQVLLAIRDASGLVNLNTAGPDILRAPIKATGADDATTESIVDAILDWRDRDDVRRPHGAEDDDYRAAGLPWTARDDSFRNIDELAHVYGMTGNLFAELAPFVTVYSQASLNPLFAPPRLVEALSASSAERQRGTANPRLGGTGVYYVYVSVDAGRGSASRETVVELTSDRRHPYTILSATEPMRVAFPRPSKENRS